MAAYRLAMVKWMATSWGAASRAMLVTVMASSSCSDLCRILARLSSATS